MYVHSHFLRKHNMLLTISYKQCVIENSPLERGIQCILCDWGLGKDPTFIIFIALRYSEITLLFFSWKEQSSPLIPGEYVPSPHHE